jgi:hypothetical protein
MNIKRILFFSLFIFLIQIKNFNMLTKYLEKKNIGNFLGKNNIIDKQHEINSYKRYLIGLTIAATSVCLYLRYKSNSKILELQQRVNNLQQQAMHMNDDDLLSTASSSSSSLNEPD